MSGMLLLIFLFADGFGDGALLRTHALSKIFHGQWAIGCYEFRHDEALQRGELSQLFLVIRGESVNPSEEQCAEAFKVSGVQSAAKHCPHSWHAACEVSDGADLNHHIRA